MSESFRAISNGEMLHVLPSKSAPWHPRNLISFFRKSVTNNSIINTILDCKFRMSLRPSKRRRVSPPDEDDAPKNISTATADLHEKSDVSEDGEIEELDGSEKEEEDDSELQEDDDDADDLEEDEVDFETDETMAQEDDSTPKNGIDSAQLKQETLPTSADQLKSTSHKHPRTSKSSGRAGTNSFKLQVEEMLNNVRPSYGLREAPAEDMLRKIKSVIEDIGDRTPISISQAEKDMLKHKIVIPFSDSSPRADAQYKLGFAKPASMNVTGSYALRTALREKDRMTLDLVVTMPSALFTEKDYLDHRYFHKRAYYLACIAQALHASKDLPATYSFQHSSGNNLLPILVIRAKQDTDFAKSDCDIHVILAMPESFFPIMKTVPTKSCIRVSTSITDVSTANTKATPTPFYNSTIRADSSVTSYLKLLHSAGVKCAGYRDACLLGRVWMRQRDISGTIGKGGFGHFEWAALVALLLQSGGAKGKPVLLPTYDGPQLFRATLVFLASKDVSRQPIVIGVADATSVKVSGQPMVYDEARGVNILYKMTHSSYRSLQKHAQTTIRMLSGNVGGQFAATFTTQIAQPLMRFDLFADSTLMDEHIRQVEKKRKNDHPSRTQHIWELLSQGLGNRVTSLTITSTERPSWPIDAARSRQAPVTIYLGLLLDPTNSTRTVERGPSAEEPQAAATFRDFWGDKAELRRFKDGSILESVVWKTSDAISLTKEIVTYILQQHLSVSCTFVGNTFAGVPGVETLFTASTAFENLRTAYRTLEENVRSLEGLPLAIRQFQASDELLRSTSTTTPFTPPYSKENPASVVLQFEGSGRWPDDLQAIQMTKIAFLLRLDQLLTTAHPNITTKLGLENTSSATDNNSTILNRAYLDIIYPSSAAFRLRIHHDRESTLLERRLADKTGTVSAKDREATALALSIYKRDFLATPLHTQAVQTLCTRHPAFSASVRLTKAWLAAHLLTPHFAPELIELLVARSFLHPYPWHPAPSSPQTGFLRTLHFLSTWDWRFDPLIVDFSGGDDMKAAEMEVVRTRFEAWRSLDPAMNRVVLFVATNYSREGTFWSEYAPGKVVAGRMTALAGAAVGAVDAQSTRLEMRTLFTSSLKDFDFVISVAPKFRRSGKNGEGKAAKSKFKNLQLGRLAADADPDRVGFEAVREYFEELQRLYGESVVLFADQCSWDVVAGLWSPYAAATTRKWKVGLGYSSAPVVGKSKKKVTRDDEDDKEDEVEVVINKDAMLSEMARLGGDIVAKIERNR